MGRSTSSLWLLPLTGDAIVVTVQPGPISGFAPIEWGGAGGSGRIAVAVVGAPGLRLGRGALLGARGVAVIRSAGTLPARGAGILLARRALVLSPGDGGGLGRGLLLRSPRCRSRAVDDGGHGRRGVDDRGHRRRRVDHGRLRTGGGRRGRSRVAGGAGSANADTEEEGQNKGYGFYGLTKKSATPRRRRRIMRRNGVRGRKGRGRGPERRSHWEPRAEGERWRPAARIQPHRRNVLAGPREL